MLLSAKLATALKFSALKLPVVETALAAGLGLAALAWSAADMSLRPSVSGAAPVELRQAATKEESAQNTRLHDEVQYIGDKFLDEQQRLHLQPVATLVQAF